MIEDLETRELVLTEPVARLSADPKTINKLRRRFWAGNVLSTVVGVSTLAVALASPWVGGIVQLSLSGFALAYLIITLMTEKTFGQLKAATYAHHLLPTFEQNDFTEGWWLEVEGDEVIYHTETEKRWIRAGSTAEFILSWVGLVFAAFLGVYGVPYVMPISAVLLTVLLVYELVKPFQKPIVIGSDYIVVDEQRIDRADIIDYVIEERTKLSVTRNFDLIPFRTDTLVAITKSGNVPITKVSRKETLLAELARNVPKPNEIRMVFEQEDSVEPEPKMEFESVNRA